MKITVMGCGVFGMALSSSFVNNHNSVIVWNKIKSDIDKIIDKYNDIEFTTDMEYAIRDCDLIVVAIPVEYLEDVSKELKRCYKSQDIVIASKGIDTKKCLFAYEILIKYLGNINIGVLSGGSFAVDMENKYLLGITLGTKYDSISNKIKNSLECNNIKIQYSDDIIGVSICGAIKNVFAIGYGMLDGAKYPDSTKFLYLTNAIYEIKDIISNLGGNSNTIFSYAGLDDIMMTCTSNKSRNYTLGSLIGSGKSNKDIEEYKSNTTVEGLGTCLSINKLLDSKNIKAPLCNILYNILYRDADYKEIINYLEKKES